MKATMKITSHGLPFGNYDLFTAKRADLGDLHNMFETFRSLVRDSCSFRYGMDLPTGARGSLEVTITVEEEK